MRRCWPLARVQTWYQILNNGCQILQFNQLEMFRNVFGYLLCNNWRNVYQMYLILSTISFSETRNKSITRFYDKGDDFAFPAFNFQFFSRSVHLLARLFSKKTSRYCQSPIVVCVVVVVQNLWHLLISLSLLKIHVVTWNADCLFTMQRRTHTSRANNPIFGHSYAPFST